MANQNDKRKGFVLSSDFSQMTLESFCPVIPTGICILSLDGNGIYIDPLASEFLGISRETFLDKSFDFLEFARHRGWHLEKLIRRAAKHQMGQVLLPEKVARAETERGTFTLKIFPQLSREGRVVRIILFIENYTPVQQKLKDATLAALFFKRFVEEALQGFFVIEDGKFIYVNDKFIEITGYHPDDLLGKKTLLDLVAPEYHEPLRENLRQLEKGDTSGIECVLQAKRKDGSTVIYSILCWKISIEGQELMQGMIADVTKEIETREKLKASEEKYRALFDHAFYGLFQAKKNWQFVTVNQAFLDTFGFDSAEEVQNLENPTSLFYNETEFEQFQSQLKRQKQIRDKILTLRKKDGKPVICKINVREVHQDDETTIFEGMVQDITEQMEAEAEINRLANFPQRNPDPIMELSEKGDILYYNPAVQKLLDQFGLDASQIGKLLPPELHLILRNMVQNQIHTQTVDTSYKNRIFQWNFHYIPTEYVFHAYGKDITDRINLEQQLLHTQKMDSIGTLAGGVAHDFNNLLMGIIGQTSLILSELDPEHPLYADIKNIETTAQKAAHLTRQLLSFSRKATGEQEIVDLNELVRETVSLFGWILKNGVEIQKELGSNLSAIYIDPAHLQQILLNLLVNARDAVPEGGKITVMTDEVHIQEGDPRAGKIVPGHYVRLRIKDNGMGIPPEHLTRIFEPFFTTKEVGKGTGLGLSVVYNFVQSAGGYIDVESDVGKGTVFSIYFRAHEIVEDEHTEQRPEAPQGPAD